jgi:putative ABC transport system permease protein
VIRFLLAQLRNRRRRAATLATGILAASVAFVLLTGSTRTSSIHVRHTLTSNFRGAYDILVRPANSFTPLEHSEQLVRENYLSGIYGGITLKQYQQIKRIPGVQVAAPIANIGTTLARAYVLMAMRPFVTGARDQLFRVHFGWTAQRGLSRYPGSDVYAYVTRRRMYSSGVTISGVAVTDPLTGKPDPVCDGFDTTPTVYAPFSATDAVALDACASTNPAGQLPHGRHGRSPFAATSAAVLFQVVFPINVAAVDPLEEAKLVHLNGAIISGHYLSAHDHERVVQRPAFPVLTVPAIQASRTLLDEQLHATIQRLSIPKGADVPGLMAAGACPAPYGSCPPSKQTRGPGGRRATAYQFVRHLRGVAIAQRSYDTSSVYTHAVRTQHQGLASLQDVTVDVYWRSSSVRYRQLGRAELAPLPVSNSARTWFDGLFGDASQSGYLDQPSDNLDVQFRKLSEAIGNTHLDNGQIGSPNLDVVGRFDPAKLPGFSPLSQVPLETYYPPALEAADARTAKLLHGRPLTPSANIGDYVQQPPLILTSLSALPALLSPQRFRGTALRQQRAPISVVRVRVIGVNGPDKLSQQRIKAVAQLIHDQTGLAVDVTAGSSPTPITIDLPAGKFGRPTLQLTEGWVKKGVAVAYLRALDRKDAALFGLVLIVCCFFLANGALASVRTRRAEIGVLRTVGWGSRQIFATVLGELVVVAIVAGVVGALLALLLVWTLGLDFPLLRVAFVLPTALLLAVIAGTAPALEASRGQPLDAVRPRIAVGRRRSARSIVALALLNARRLPLRSGLAAVALAIGVAALTFLVAIEHAFSGTLVGTLLGNAISVQVRGPDLVAAGITIALAAFTVADVLYLNLRERAPEHAVLQATGWGYQHILRAALIEAATIALLGSAAGAAAGIAFGATFLSIPAGPLALGALIAAAAATTTSLIAASIPAAKAALTPPLLALRDE